MLYNLPTGRTIEITLDMYLSMTDEDIEYLVAYNVGDHIEDPFTYSSLHNMKASDQVDEEITLDLTDLTSDDKLFDLDIDLENLE